MDDSYPAPPQFLIAIGKMSYVAKPAFVQWETHDHIVFIVVEAIDLSSDVNQHSKFELSV